ncbi:hypothetical protein ACFFRR_003338 [Megaselia abdita]
MLLLKSLILAIFTSAINGYDRNIKIVDLFKCKELLLEGDYVSEVFPISLLQNNNPELNEILRMKFYVLGHDINLRISQEDNFNMKHYLVYFHGNGGTRNHYSSGIALTDLKYNSWNLLTVAETDDLTDRFYYTMLHLAITKDGRINFYKNNTDLFLSVEVIEFFLPKFFSFSRSQFEENSRIFFDCPNEEEEQYYYYSDEVREQGSGFYEMRSVVQGCSESMQINCWCLFFLIIFLI